MSRMLLSLAGVGLLLGGFWGMADAEMTISALFTWQDNSDNEEGFKVLRSVDGEEASLIGDVAANETSLVDSPLEIGHTYCYQVMATNIFGDSGPTPPSCAATKPPDDPTVQRVVLSVTFTP